MIARLSVRGRILRSGLCRNLNSVHDHQWLIPVSRGQCRGLRKLSGEPQAMKLLGGRIRKITAHDHKFRNRSQIRSCRRGILAHRSELRDSRSRAFFGPYDGRPRQQRRATDLFRLEPRSRRGARTRREDGPALGHVGKREIDRLPARKTGRLLSLRNGERERSDDRHPVLRRRHQRMKPLRPGHGKVHRTGFLTVFRYCAVIDEHRNGSATPDSRQRNPRGMTHFVCQRADRRIRTPIHKRRTPAERLRLRHRRHPDVDHHARLTQLQQRILDVSHRKLRP